MSLRGDYGCNKSDWWGIQISINLTCIFSSVMEESGVLETMVIADNWSDKL